MRKVLDCRDHPSPTKCTLTISGEEEEVLRAGFDHAVSVHGEAPSPELRELLRKGLKSEAPSIRERFERLRERTLHPRPRA